MPGVSKLQQGMRWIRRTSWQARLATGVLAVGLGLLLFYGSKLGPGLQAELWGLWTLAFAGCSYRFWQKLLGPVFFYDMLRNTRQGRSFVLRGLYACALLVVLFLCYSSWLPINAGWKVFLQGTIRYDDAARFAESFFLMFLLVQFMAVFLLAPVYAASSLTEEKERRTLGFLLATHLDSSEIILGKFASRLLSLLLVLLTGLPVLSFLQLLGGVDPHLVLAGFAATFATALSLGALGVLNSAYAMRPRGAVVSTYLEAAAYLIFSLVCGLGGLVSGSRLDPFYWIGAGNIVLATGKLANAAATGTVATTVAPVLGEYILFHVLAAATCITWAAVKLRLWNQEDRLHAQHESAPVSIRFPNGELVTLATEPSVLFRPRPPLGDNPLLWKERYIERGLTLHPLVQGGLIFVTVLSLSLAGFAFLVGVLLTSAVEPSSLGAFSNTWLRLIGTPMACLVILGVAIRAATGVSRERDRNTLDSLLTTPLEVSDILWAKWWGSILSMHFGWWCLASVWFLTLCTGGLFFLALPLVLTACGVYAAFAASVGLWFSISSTSTVRATVGSLLTVFSAGTVMGILGQPFYNRLNPSWVSFAHIMHWLNAFQKHGLSIPFTLDFLMARGESSYSRFFSSSLMDSSAVIAGLACYAAAAWLFWRSAQARFARMAGRTVVPTAKTVQEISSSLRQTPHDARKVGEKV